MLSLEHDGDITNLMPPDDTWPADQIGFRSRSLAEILSNLTTPVIGPVGNPSRLRLYVYEQDFVAHGPRNENIRLILGEERLEGTGKAAVIDSRPSPGWLSSRGSVPAPLLSLGYNPYDDLLISLALGRSGGVAALQYPEGVPDVIDLKVTAGELSLVGTLMCWPTNQPFCVFRLDDGAGVAVDGGTLGLSSTEAVGLLRNLTDVRHEPALIVQYEIEIDERMRSLEDSYVQALAAGRWRASLPAIGRRYPVLPLMEYRRGASHATWIPAPGVTPKPPPGALMVRNLSDWYALIIDTSPIFDGGFRLRIEAGANLRIVGAVGVVCVIDAGTPNEANCTMGEADAELVFTSE